MLKDKLVLLCCILCAAQGIFGAEKSIAVTSADYVAVPPFVSSGAPPLVMLVMGRDHKLYYEAYNDASDLDGVVDSNGDTHLEIRYTPSIDYYGYFDSYKCYAYDSGANKRFNPTSKTTDKTCDGTEWSGDFLNYLTMSRMDTMRKVLYGGYRSTDTETSTVLQRVYVPQDAHSWGKEYTSIAVDGYDINKYTPFVAPPVGSSLRHLFASTTLSDNGAPLLRYALNNSHRIWEWVAVERPVADNRIETSGSGHPEHPDGPVKFQNIVDIYANAANKMGGGDWTNWGIRNHIDQKYPSANGTIFGAIDGVGNPYSAGYGYPIATDPRSSGAVGQENYLAIFKGNLEVVTGGNYRIGVDGDDAVEVLIDGTVVTGFYNAHGASGSAQNIVTINLSAGEHSVEFRMEEANGDDKYYLYWDAGDPTASTLKIIPNTSLKDLTLSTYKLSLAASTIVDLEVRVKVCDTSVGIEANCKPYPNGQYKPTGLLQRHGEPKRMYFGLLTGSYAKNTSGGVLRKRIGDINNEIIKQSGVFNTSVNGIIQTLNKMRIYGFNYTDSGDNYSYTLNCGWISNRSMKEGECRPWGNPVAEMMYETQRYFAGKGTATAAYDYTPGALINGIDVDDDSKLGLPRATWNDPYDKANGGFDSCSKPFMLVLSDINPSYDSDQLPGVATSFGSGIIGDLPSALPVFDAEALANVISANEPEVAGNKYIGESNGTNDMICSPKTVTGFGAIRGLCPEEPTKMGGYYSAAVAYYGHKNDLRPDLVDDSGKPYDNKVTTYAVGLASPLPRIELTLGADKKQITLVPFGKSVAKEGDTHALAFTPTNTIVDFFVDTITPTYGKFRINYEDVEQGADHDMDAIVIYEYQLIDDLGANVTDPVNATQVKISLDARDYAAGGFIQHMGYIISGTDADGAYLEVHDKPDNPATQDVLYGFDTPPEGSPAGTKLLMVASRIFRPTTDEGVAPAELLKNPLWYAAKWGAFDDKNHDNIPNGNEGDEWDKDKDGVPDTYFYVTNPLRLEEQLNRSFAAILNQASSGTAASVISNTRSGEGAVYQSIFYPTKTDSTANANTVSWVGEVHSFLVDAQGNMREDTFANKKLDVKGPDLNHNGRVYHEDINMNCVLDTTTIDGVTYTEDTNGNGDLDTEFNTISDPTACSANDAAFLSELDAIIVYENGVPKRYYDVNGDGILQAREKIWNVAPAVDDSHPIKYLWNSTDWLNSASLDPLSQRSTYLSNSDQRYIFTWIDGDGDGVVDTTSGEIKDFIWPATPPVLTDLADTNEIYPYLHLYSSFGDEPTAISLLSTTNYADFTDFLLKETEREIKYFRGNDDVDTDGRPLPLNIGGSDIAGTELRSRQFAGTTWRLGDIDYSTPTAVGRPSEGYHLLYRDTSYADFATQYENRRIVIYTGANDGMLHAFNGGFYDSYHKQFCRQIKSDYNPYDTVDTNDTGCELSTSMPELGAELWAYIPFNLLPHLHWLTEPGYEHSYYVDQKPRIFDAKVFKDDTTDLVHPHGWGTIMVVGMRFGGATIIADTDKTDGAYDSTKDPTMKSAFLIFDITDPELKPTLLGEITMPEMGFSTSYPTMVVMKDGDHDGHFEDYDDASPETGENRWFLAFGSGPADASGDPDPDVLATAESSQKAKFYMLDLVKLASKNELWSLTNGGALTRGLHWYSELDDNSFVSDPITVDYDLDYNADVLYYGIVTALGSNIWGGQLRRIVIDDRNDIDEDQDPMKWNPDSVLIDVEQPITAAPTVALDDEGRNWVFFGTGRYFVSTDGTDQSPQSYYGIKEPLSFVDAKKDWTTVSKSNLVDTTNYRVFTDTARTVDLNGIPATWNDLVTEQASKSGWYIDFVEDTTGNFIGERNLGQAALLGGALTFTTFIPSSDICVAGGESWLWAEYYKTGTAYYGGILGTSYYNSTLDLSLRKLTLGQGLATSPNLHVGSEAGSKAFVQTSTGAIEIIKQETPHEVKSGMRSWKEGDCQ